MNRIQDGPCSCPVYCVLDHEVGVAKCPQCGACWRSKGYGDAGSNDLEINIDLHARKTVVRAGDTTVPLKKLEISESGCITITLDALDPVDSVRDPIIKKLEAKGVLVFVDIMGCA
jgi:hypothetical protein